MFDFNFVHLELTIDDQILFDFNGIITQNTIVTIAKMVEATLMEAKEDETKIRTIFELIVEIMQNILSYSADSIEIGNNMFQSKGAIVITHRSSEEFYDIRSGNTVLIEQQKKIQDSLDEVNSLSAQEIKEVYKERRRDGRNRHGRGAGLGFLDIARKSKNKLQYNFIESDEDGKLYFALHVKI